VFNWSTSTPMIFGLSTPSSGEAARRADRPATGATMSAPSS
jgi:hypothetical protein